MGKYSKVRSRENYIEEKLSTKSQSSKNIFNIAVNSIDKLCKMQFKVKNFDVVIADVLKMELEQRDDEIVTIIQEWINKQSKAFNTIKVELSAINKYLKYYKIKIDFNEEIEFPQNIQEELYAVSITEIHKILEVSKFKQKGYYLCLISSGCRPVEVIGLKKKNFFWTGTRFGAHIPAHLTKKKISRTTFFSVECNSYLNVLLKRQYLGK